MIRAVFMDIDNTLLDFDAAAQEGMAHCFEDAGLIYKPEMFSVFKEENDRIWKKIGSIFPEAKFIPDLEKDRTGDPDHG